MSGKARFWFRCVMAGVTLLVLAAALWWMNQPVRLPQAASLNAPAAGQSAPAEVVTNQAGPTLENVNIAALKDRGDLAVVWNHLLYLVEGQTGTIRQLSDAGEAARPRWSPDGQWLAYVRLTDSARQEGTLWLVHRDGTRSRQVPLPTPTIRAGDYAWSPTGNELLVPARDVWLVPAEGAPRLLVPNSGSRLASAGFAPDGKQIAYVVATPDDETIFTLSLAADSKPVEQLKRPRSGLGVWGWWPDGQGLVIRSFADIWGANDEASDVDLYTLPLGSRQLKRIGDRSFAGHLLPTVPPTGHAFIENGWLALPTEAAAEYGAKSLAICQMVSATCEYREPPRGSAFFVATDLSPDGKQVVMGLAQEWSDVHWEWSGTSVWVTNTADTEARQLYALRDLQVGGWTPDGSRILYLYDGWVYLVDPMNDLFTWERLIEAGPPVRNEDRPECLWPDFALYQP